MESARALLTDAGRRPNPELEATVENFGGDLGSGRVETTVQLGQTFELGGKGGLRKKSAQAGVTQAQADLISTRLEVIEAVDEAFLDAWLAQERAARLRRAEQIAAQAVAAADKRHEAGAAPVVERTRAEVERISRAMDRRLAEVELEVARRKLAAIWGAKELVYGALRLGPPSDPMLPDSLRVVELIGHHPEVQVAQARVAIQAARVNEAKAARVTDLLVHGGVRRFEEDRTSAGVAGVVFSLPLWNRQRGAVGSAIAEREAAVADLRVVEQNLAAELRSASWERASAWEGYRDAQDHLVPTAADALRQLETGFASGRFGYVDLLEGRRALLEAELRTVDLERDYWRAQLRLDRLLSGAGELEGGR